MIIKKELIKREIAGDVILVPVGKSVYDANGLFVMNELAAFIWDILPNVDTEAEVCKAVLEAYDVSEEIAARDVADFLGRLKQMEIL